jgi:TP901 family phage tail tape measure protein
MQVTGVGKASSDIDKIRDKFDKLQKQGAKGFAIGVGAAATTAGLNLIGSAVSGIGNAAVETVQKAASFERGMLNINSIAKISNADLEAMGETVLKMSGEFGQSAQTMTDALYDINSSGFAGAKGIEVLEAASKAATAGLATTAEAASGITAVLNSYGLQATDAGQVSDVLFKTVERGVVTFSELSAEIGKTAALASPLGVSIEEVGAALAVMTRHGLGAEDATTQLNAIMASMLKPAADAATLAKELGLNWSAAGLKANGLAGSMSAMIQKTGGSEEKMAILLGDVRAIRGAFSLAAKSGGELNDELKIMKQEAPGATEAAFGIQSQGAAFKMAQATAKFDAAMIRLGTVTLPLVAGAADLTSGALEQLGDILAGTGFGSANYQAALEAWEAKQRDAGAGAEELAHDLADLGHFAFLAGHDVSTAAGDVGKALGDVATRGQRSARVVTKSMGDIADALDATWADLSDTADQAAEDIFGPMERRAELAANKLAQGAALGEIAKPRQKGETGAEFAERIAGARADLLSLQKDYFTFMAEMGGRGELTAKELARIREALKEQLKSAAAEEAISLLALMALLDRVAAKAKGVFGVGLGRGGISLPGRPNPGEARQHGGPVAANRAYVVGEQGPELFVPGASGAVIPNAGSGSPATISGGGGWGDGMGAAILAALELGNAQRARLVAQEPMAARPQTARGDLARQAAFMPGGRL